MKGGAKVKSRRIQVKDTNNKEESDRKMHGPEGEDGDEPKGTLQAGLNNISKQINNPKMEIKTDLKMFKEEFKSDMRKELSK